MVLRLHLAAIFSAVFAATVVNADIKVFCLKDSVQVTWRVSAELVPYAARFFLGSCMFSRLNVLPSEEGELQFNYTFADCKFKKLIQGKKLIYQNNLIYRPKSKAHPAAFTQSIECVYKRPEGWVPPFLNPGSGMAAGRSGLVFHMALLNEQLTSISKTNVIPLGSFMPVWAAVEQKSHQPLLLLMEECVAAGTAELQPDSRVYPIIGNKGCLFGSVRGNAMFLPRYHSSALVLYLQAFKFGVGERVYIHCKLVAWDPNVLDETKKACHYKMEDGSWELLDDPLQSTICSCCESTCKSRPRRGIEEESQGLSHMSVLGPLTIVDQSHDASVGSDTSADSQV